MWRITPLIVALGSCYSPACSREQIGSLHGDFWSPANEDAYQKFKRMFEGYRALEGQGPRSHLKVFRGVNEHHVAMLPILDRLERVLLGEKDDDSHD